MIEVPPSHCVFPVLTCVCVCVFSSIVACTPHLNAWHTVWHFLEAADRFVQMSECGILANCCCCVIPFFFKQTQAKGFCYTTHISCQTSDKTDE